MPFREDASALIQQKKFDDFEALWMNQIESDPSDVDAFLNCREGVAQGRAAHAVRHAPRACSPMCSRKEGYGASACRCSRSSGRLSKHPAHHRPPIEEALRKSLGDHKNFDRVFQFANFSDPQSNPVERAEKIEMWLAYDEGECFFMAGRGAGVVTELNPELGDLPPRLRERQARLRTSRRGREVPHPRCRRDTSSARSSPIPKRSRPHAKQSPARVLRAHPAELRPARW